VQVQTAIMRGTM